MLIKIYPDNPSEKLIQQVVECLSDGGIIIYPTDTVYGLGCDIFKTRAVEKIARIRGLKPNKANFSFVCSDLSHLSDFVKPFNTNIYRLMKKALPGPFTFILDANNKVPKIFQSNKKTVGIRVPDNNIALLIVRILGNPIMSTSIHDEDEVIEYTTDPELIYEKYRDLVDIVIDGGYGDNEPSTVVDCTSEPVTVIRKGKGDISLL
ncbi:MAG: threonylcarbamoyl-AMP synthase [Bacteroidales bacterium]|nr:threonylcarbamoyl-AMP synthase [Bacteroidales bacterium]